MGVRPIFEALQKHLDEIAGDDYLKQSLVSAVEVEITLAWQRTARYWFE